MGIFVGWIVQKRWLTLTAFLLLIPPALVTFRHFGFEGQRWRESDYAPTTSDDE